MTIPIGSQSMDWAPSIYYAESLAKCQIDRAWSVLINYRSWNPSFAGAKVARIRGAPGGEGETVLVSKTPPGLNGELFPDFYCETVRITPHCRIAWYVYAKEGQPYCGQVDPFRNFVDFALRDEAVGVRFSICYYAQNRLTGDLLSRERGFMTPLLQDIATAFRDHCEQGP